jgi:hypothetical protein
LITLAFLPVISLGCLFAWINNANRHWGWRRSLLRSLVIWGSWIVVSTEVLSLFHGITVIGLSLAWTAFIAVCLGGLFRSRKPLAGLRGKFLVSGILLVPIAAIFLLTGLVAWLAAPDTADSLNYHMPRVAHWAQNRSVEHFSTGIEQQNSRPPFAEYAILHFYVLGQGDRLANFVQWLAMCGSVIGVSLLAALLGAAPVGQYLAAIFVASLPMGIVQASSTMNDYVVGLWMVCAVEVFLSVWLDAKTVETKSVGFLAGAAGLAIATKPIAFAYLLPFALAMAFLLLRKVSLAKFAGYVVLTLFVCSALNAGSMLRNTITYGNPMEPGQAALHTNQLHDWRGLVSNLLRNAGLQASTPWPQVNYQLSRLIQGIHFKMGVPLDDARTTAHGEFWIRPLSAVVGENTAPNPLHAYLIVTILILAMFMHKKVRWTSAAYLGLVLATFVIFSYVFKWQIFGSRYHLPFFVLMGAAVGVMLDAFAKRWVEYLLIAIFGLSALWPLLGNEYRPLLLLLQKANISSALSASHQEVDYLGINPGNNAFNEIAMRIQEQQCSEVLLMLGGNSPEYYWWMELGAPKNAVRIEWLVRGTPSTRYENIPDQACAIICEDCTAVNSIRSMSKVYSADNFGLFMR